MTKILNQAHRLKLRNKEHHLFNCFHALMTSCAFVLSSIYYKSYSYLTLHSENCGVCLCFLWFCIDHLRGIAYVFGSVLKYTVPHEHHESFKLNKTQGLSLTRFVFWSHHQHLKYNNHVLQCTCTICVVLVQCIIKNNKKAA